MSEGFLDENQWKRVLGGAFIALSIFCFFMYYHNAPAGVFSFAATNYSVTVTDGSVLDGNFNATVDQSPARDNSGFEIPIDDLGLRWLMILLVSGVVSAIITGIGYRFPGWNRCWQVGGGLIIYFGVIIVAFSALGLGSILLGLLGTAIHVASIGGLLYVLNTDLRPHDLDFREAELYIQQKGRLAQGALSLGLGIGIGGVLTFASSTTSGALSVAFLVGIFFFPLLGFTVHQYYRIHRVEGKFRDESFTTAPDDTVSIETRVNIDDAYCGTAITIDEAEDLANEIRESIEEHQNLDEDISSSDDK